MKTKFILSVVAITVVLFAFLAGAAIGKRTERANSVAAWTQLSKVNAVGAFHTYDSLSRYLAQGRVEFAKCVTEMYGSTHFNEVRQCLDDPICRRQIESDVRKAAPQLLKPSQEDLKKYESHTGCGNTK
jgi:hypothetical protein